MSLRVLLADESASIKKVFQLGLQDFAADVKTVQSGVDVLEVAENFNPDIIFADVLLQKKNGYDVCKELKNHATLNSVPVILMWSSFMELDPQKFQDSQAEGEMEKPFEVDAMRSHIQKLVKKTNDQQLSSFLKFPKAIKSDFIQEFEEQKENFKNRPPEPQGEEPALKVITPPAPMPSVDGMELSSSSPQVNATSDDHDNITQNSVFNQPVEEFSAELEEVEEINTITEFPKTPDTTPPSAEPKTTAPDDFELTHDEIAVEEWRTKPLSDTNFNEESEETSTDEADQFQSVELKPNENLELDDFLYKPEPGLPDDEKPPIVEVRTLDYGEEDNLTPAPKSADAGLSVNRDEIEAIVRAHAQEIIKMNIQEMLPQIIEKVTREELEKLLKEELKMKS